MCNVHCTVQRKEYNDILLTIILTLILTHSIYLFLVFPVYVFNSKYKIYYTIYYNSKIYYN